MNSDAARVIVVLPTGRSSYFGPDKYAIAWQVRQALRIAGGISPGAGVDVVLYGDPAVGRSADGGTAVRMRVEPESLEEWTGEWATISDAGGLSFLGDRRPTTRVEEVFEVDRFSITCPLVALREVIATLREAPEPPLVLFRLDNRLREEEMVLAIRDAGPDAAFWQLFGWREFMGDSFWIQEGLYRGRVLPNLAVHFSANWSHRAVARRFSRWRKKTLG
ncbi:hypothetical protein ACE14D_08140 [Streptomyces sp. Act-28]